MAKRLLRACTTLLSALLILGWSAGNAAAQTCDLATSGAIGGIVFLDANSDSTRQAGETGINGVGIRITGPTGAVVTATSGGASSIPGMYTSGPVCEAGTYDVEVISVPAGYVLTSTSPVSITLTRNPADGKLSKNGKVDFALQSVACVSSIGDRVWNDLNADGIQDAGEPGIPGVTVQLLQGGAVIATTTTDVNGLYHFQVPCSQSFTVVVVPPANFTSSPSNNPATDDNNDSDGSPVDVSVGQNQNRTDIDFGFYALCQGSIGDFVWHDLNRDGIQDVGEHGIEGVEVQLIAGDGSVMQTTITDANGHYQFAGVCPGSYSVRVNPVTVPDGYTATLTSPPAGGDSTNDSNGSPAAVVLSTFNSVDTTIDFGYVTPCAGQIGDFVWHDSNANGIQDAGEAGIPGVRVILYAQSAPNVALAAVTTNASGAYLFDGLCGGDYIVEVDPTTLPNAALVPSPENQGSDDAADSDGGADHRAEVTLPDDTTDLTIDFGYHKVKSALVVSKTAAGRYNRNITWTLTKTVSPTSHTGQAGQTAGSSTWRVTTTKSESTSGFQVTGQIVIQNGNGFPVDFSVADMLNDGTTAVVSCPASTVAADSSITCSYTASPAGSTATLNTVTVNSLTPGVTGGTATAAVAFVETVTGDSSTTLADPRFSYSQLISAGNAPTFPETFACPSDPTKYTNGTYVRIETNTATLTGPNTNLSASAAVTITCTIQQWGNETAVGAGIRYPNTSNWFMYTPYTTSKVDLIAGQHYDAGDIFMSRSGGRTTIRIVLAAGFRWASVAGVLKIQPFNTAPTTYLQPGQFQYHFTLPSTASTAGSTVSVSGNTVTVTLPGTSARFYGIHGDVQRLLP